MIGKATKVVYAWGEKVKFVNPVIEPEWLKRLVPQPYCFKKTKDGYPYHPRNLEKFAELIPFCEATVEPQNFETIVPARETPIQNPILIPQNPIVIPQREIKIQIDESIMEFPLPPNKTKNDIIAHIVNFFYPKF